MGMHDIEQCDGGRNKIYARRDQNRNVHFSWSKFFEQLNQVPLTFPQATALFAPFSAEKCLGQLGGAKIPHSFQLLRRPGCTAKFICFHKAGGFENRWISGCAMFAEALAAAICNFSFHLVAN
jgi:hypothetical protein